MLGKSDWLAIITGLILFGGGGYMSTLPQQVIRGTGIVFILVGVIGLAVWFGYYRNTTEADGAGTRDQMGNVSGNKGIVTQGQKGDNTLSK